MAETSFIFNSINGDRKYKAEDFRDYFASFIGNGVFPNPSDCLQVMGNNSDMTLTYKTGKGWINGAIYNNSNDMILPIDPADGVLNRIDRITLRLDTAGRQIIVVIKKGDFASSPVAPALERDADMYELGIADILVSAGATQITQANITDLRLDNNLCGVVHGTIDQIDLTTLFNQYTEGFQQKEQDFTNEFTEWFNTVKGQLSGDVAGNLQNQITDLGDEIDSHKADSTYQLATGTATAITVSMATLTNGYAKTFIASANNNGAATTINGKNLYKPNTTTAPKLIAGKAYTVWYNSGSDCFFIKASAEGNTIAAHVLAGDTFSTDVDTGLVGTMDLSNLTADNIKSGVTVNGVTGVYTPKIWELPIDVTHTVAVTPWNSTTHNFWYAYNNIKLFQSAGSTYIQIYYKNKLMITTDILLNLSYDNAHAYINDNKDIYIFTGAKIFTFLWSEKYATAHSNNTTGFTGGTMGNVNFRVGNYIYFLAGLSSNLFLVKVDISSGIAVQNSSLQLNYVMTYESPLFIDGNMAYYKTSGTNIIYKVNLDTMTQTTISINAYGGTSAYTYIGHYNNTHFIVASNSTTSHFTIIEYPEAGGSATSVYELAYNTALTNDLGTAPAYYFNGYSQYLVQATDTIVVLFPGSSTNYDDSIVYFDMSIKKVIRAKTEGGTCINVNGTIKGLICHKVDNYAVIEQFSIDQSKL